MIKQFTSSNKRLNLLVSGALQQRRAVQKFFLILLRASKEIVSLPVTIFGSPLGPVNAALRKHQRWLHFTCLALPGHLHAPHDFSEPH
jgi:hypothetical protein